MHRPDKKIFFFLRPDDSMSGLPSLKTTFMKASVSALFIVFFLIFTKPISDGDFFWHIRTGEWIWQHKSLPQEDPFSYTTALDDGDRGRTERVSFILKGYWLSQIILFGIWKLLGPAGIIFFRALIYTLIVAFVFFWTRRVNSNPAVAVVAALLLASLLSEFPGERPQLFTFLLTPLALYLLERIRKQTSPGKDSFVLPVVMFLWSNLHGGYILGIAMILIYAIGALGTALKQKQQPSPLFLSVCIISILATILNPNTYYVFLMLAETSSSYLAGIQENMPPLAAAIRLHDYYPAYYLFLLGAAFVLITRYKTMDLTHILLIIFLGGLSLTGLRYMPFLLMTAPFVAAPVTLKRFSYQLAILFLLILAWIGALDKKEILKISVSDQFPEQAVSFMKENRLQGKIFNYYAWGGYLIQHLPENPVFIDGRGLSGQVYDLYANTVRQQLGPGDALEAYGITLILMPAISQISGDLYPLTIRLYLDRAWSLVYYDKVSLVFAKNIAANEQIIRRSAVRKELIFEQAMAAARKLLQQDHRNGRYWRTLGTAQYFRGDWQAARESFSQALRLDAGDEDAGKMLKILGPASPLSQP